MMNTNITSLKSTDDLNQPIARGFTNEEELIEQELSAMVSSNDGELLESNLDEEQKGGGQLWPSKGNLPPEEYSLNDAIDHIGFGKFQVKVMLIVGWCWTADAMEMMVLSILSPELKCDWNLSSLQEALITTGINFSVLLVLIFGLASAKAPSYTWILVLRFLVGFGIGGVPQAVTIATELLPSKNRGKAIIILELFWALGSVFAAALAIFCMSSLGWRWYLVFITIPIIIFLLGGLWLPESPHYLLTTNRYDEVVTLLKRIADHNGKKLPPGKLIPGEINEKRGSIIELFNKQWCKTTTLLWIIWFTSALTYYGIVLLTTEVFQTGIDGCNPYPSAKNESNATCHKLNKQDYTDFMLTSIAEFPGIMLAFILLDWIGRKKTMSGLFVLASASFLLMNICVGRTMGVVFMFAVRGFVTGTFQTAYVYTPEVLPTSIRAVGLGACSMFARIGAMITPFIAQVLIKDSFYLVVGVYSGFLIVCAVTSFLLPIETKGKDLQSSTATALVERKGYQAFK